MNKRGMLLVAVVLIAAVVTVALAQEKAKPPVNYPEGYRNWTHVKSMVIQEGHKVYDKFGGIHHIYANKKALAAMEKGKPYPDGSIFVFDLLEAESKDNAIAEGPRKLVGVIEKNAKKYAETGGWGFEGFKGDTKDRAVTDMKTCFSCHESKKDSGFVFSKFRK